MDGSVIEYQPTGTLDESHIELASTCDPLLISSYLYIIKHMEWY